MYMREIANYISNHTGNDSNVEVKVSMFLDNKDKGEDHLKEIKCSEVTDEMTISGVGYKVIGDKQRTVLIAINWVI